MDLKQFLPGQEKKSSKESFWGLIIEPGWVQAGIWRIEEGVAQVISSGTPTAWELDEDLISAADTALSIALQNFPEGAEEPSKTVFGVVSSWVSGGVIKADYLEMIKKICRELSLTPVGFVVLPEAIAHFLKSEEGSPINAVILGVYKDVIEVSVFSLGNLMGTTQVARSVSIVDDVCEGLSRFSQGETIPSRFILYDGKEGELEEVKQALLKVNWDDFENLKFLHTPKVETVIPERKIYAVSLAGASELADVISIEAVKSEKEEKVEMGESIVEEEGALSPEELGFELEKDVAQVKKQEEPSRILPEPEEEDFSVSNIIPIPTEVSPRGRSIFSPLSTVVTKFASLGKNLFGKFRDLRPAGVKTSLASAGKKTFIFGLGFLFLILVAGFIIWWYVPSAVVTVYVSPRNLEERSRIIVDPKAANPNFSERILPGEELKTVVSGEKTTSTTGTKTVGEKAKGEVTLYRVGPMISLAAGTVLYGPENMKFSLDDSVAIASGSASSPGTTKTGTTAFDIGAQYNLAGGASFTVGNYSVSDIEAKNESAFSGGTSREISAVAADDQKKLEKELEDELKEKAASELTQKLSADKIFIEESLSSTASSRTFSNKVGDEATVLKLSLSLATKAFAVQKDNLLDFAQEILKDKVPEGFILRKEQIDIEFGQPKDEGGVYEFSGSIEANLLPEVDPTKVAKKITGKYPSVAEDFLIKEIPGFVRAEIKLRPHLPGRLGSLPRLVKHIDVIISAEQ